MRWLQWLSRRFNRMTKSLSTLGIGLRAALSGGAPGGWASDHREETAHNTGFNYIAIHAIAAQVAGATVTVFADGEQQDRRQSYRKSLASRVGSFTRWKSTYGADDRETDPLPTSHPLVRLLKRPNPYESGASFRYRQAQQIRLTGTCLIWNVPSVSGPTCERYVIPTAMASPVAPTIELPRGGWRISPVASRYTPIVDDGYIDCPSWYRILGQIVDARQVQMIRLPHAWYLDDGQSPLSAGAKWVDAGDAVDAARYHQLKNGIDPSLVWNLPPDVSPDQDEIDRVQAKISAKYGGPENVGRVMVAQSGTSITPLSVSPKEMCYAEGFHDFKAAILALHQTPPVAVGLQEPGAYAAYNASMKAWRHSAVQPLCNMLAESDTEHLAPQFGDGLTIEMESDTVDDTDLIETQLRNDLAARVRTKNEWRAVRGMPPLPGRQGDELVGSDGASAPNSVEPTQQTVPPVSIRRTPLNHETTFTDVSTTQTKSHPESDGFPGGFQTDPNHVSTDILSESDSSNWSQTHGNEQDLEQHRIELMTDLLYGHFGNSVLFEDRFSNSKSNTFDPEKHPRDGRGRFRNTGTANDVSVARNVASEILSGDRTAALPNDLLHHLSLLDTKTLESLHEDHGVVPPPKERQHLIRSIMARLSDFPKWDAGAFSETQRSPLVEVHVQNASLVNERLPRRAAWHASNLLTTAEWKQLVGAQPGAHVHVFPVGHRGVEIFIDHPDYQARRELRGQTMQNLMMQVSPQKQRSGIATRALSEQVKTGAKLGFKSIKAWASGNGRKIQTQEEFQVKNGPRSNGYYTWARLGFHGSLEQLMRDRKISGTEELKTIAADFKKTFPGVTDVYQLMETELGRRWWHDYGGEFDGVFDLAETSRSRKVLTQYLAEKAETKNKKTLYLALKPRSTERDCADDEADQAWDEVIVTSEAPADRNGIEDHLPQEENPDTLSEEDEKILDRIWNEIAEKQSEAIQQ